jgi:hypothetical protein
MLTNIESALASMKITAPYRMMRRFRAAHHRMTLRANFAP